jgi:hypothetical protein
LLGSARAGGEEQAGGNGEIMAHGT